MARLPVDAVRGELLAALETGPVVLSAPTGSGKSTQVPRWCPGPVLVVEPRRVACRTLAARVAHLEGVRVGAEVGYQVRDDSQRGPKTRIEFVTPGIALRSLDRLDDYGTVVLDEFHERSLDLDLLFAILRARRTRLVVMSATLEADRIAEALGGRHVRAEGRTFPVEVTHDDQGPGFPTARQLTERVVRGVQRLSSLEGDLLVFLPGKAEIGAAASALSGKAGPRRIHELHGGLSPRDQAAVFATDGPPKIILSTNVAETSVTVPGVRGVIDGGLVRQTRYHQGRGALSLAPIARDSADQRAGRAGRVAPGRCLRLWGPTASLKDRTLPELYRESLVPLVLGALAAGHDVRRLPFLDPPKDHAIETAVEELVALGALDKQGGLTERGARLFHLPLDPFLGRLLVEAETRGTLDDMIDLVAVLASDRPPFPDPGGMLDDDDPRIGGCDVVAAIRGLRRGEAGWFGFSGAVLADARANRRRLRVAFGRSGEGPGDGPVDRAPLVGTALAADPRCAHLARVRRKHVAWANGGTEIELDRRSALSLVTRDHVTKLPEAMAVFGVRAMTDGPTTRIIATAASPLTLAGLRDAGLGTARPGTAKMQRGRVVCEVERVFAGKVLATETIRPQGDLLREVFAKLVAEGRALKGARAEITRRLQRAGLLVRLYDNGLVSAYAEEVDPLRELPDAPLEWVAATLEQLGLEAQEDLGLLDVQDVLPPAVPEHLEAKLARDYPERLELGDATYRVEYQPRARKVLLHMERGNRKTPPPRQYLPKFPGLVVHVQAGGTFHRLGR